MNLLIFRTICDDLHFDIEERITLLESMNKRLEMALKIGLPGGNMFLALLRPDPPLYQAYLGKLLNPNNPLVISQFEKIVSQPAIQQAEFEWRDWVICLNWLYKKRFDLKHKLPGRLSYCRLFEPVGEILNSTLHLVEYVYLYGKKGDYTHHWEWFALIAAELRDYCLSITPNGKYAKVKDLRANVKALREGKNPFSRDLAPHLWNLIDAALNLQKITAHRQNVICRFTLRNPKKKQYGFTSAIAHWATKLNENKNIAPMWNEKSGVYLNEGSGRGKRKIT
jgi:hypothetical protein